MRQLSLQLMFRARRVNLVADPQTEWQRQSRQTPLLLSLAFCQAQGLCQQRCKWLVWGCRFNGLLQPSCSLDWSCSRLCGLYAMPGGRMCAAEVSAVRSWSQQHVEWDRFSVSVMMTAREMLGSGDYKSLVLRMEQPIPGQGGCLFFNVS